MKNEYAIIIKNIKFCPPHKMGPVFVTPSPKKSPSVILTKPSNTLGIHLPLFNPNRRLSDTEDIKKEISKLWYKTFPHLGKVTIQIKSFDQLTSLEIHNILKLRQDIFILEQNIMYGDIDGQDLNSLHVWCETSDSHTFLSYLRIVPLKEKSEVSMGRVLTVPEARNQGVANHLVKKGIEFAKAQYPSYLLKLTARKELWSFYEKLGFQKTGSLFFYPANNPIPLMPMIYTRKYPDRINKREKAWA